MGNSILHPLRHLTCGDLVGIMASLAKERSRETTLATCLLQVELLAQLARER